MNGNFPPRGSEDARLMLAAIYDLFHSHQSPIECLGFKTGPGIPWPTVVEIDAHVEQIRHLLFELCDDREQFKDYDQELQGVRNRAVRLISKKSPELEQLEEFLLSLKHRTLERGIASSVLILTYGALLTLIAHWAARQALIEGSPWQPVLALGIFIAVLAKFFHWFADFSRRTKSAYLIAIASGFPLAVYYFLKSEDLLRGLIKEMNPLSFSLILPLAGYLGFACGLAILRRMNELRKESVRGAIQGISIDFSIMPLPEGRKSVVQREFKNTIRRARLLWIPTLVPGLCTVAVTVGLLFSATRRSPILPASKGEVLAQSNLKAAHGKMSRLQEQLAQMASQEKIAKQNALDLEAKLEEKSTELREARRERYRVVDETPSEEAEEPATEDGSSDVLVVSNPASNENKTPVQTNPPPQVNPTPPRQDLTFKQKQEPPPPKELPSADAMFHKMIKDTRFYSPSRVRWTGPGTHQAPLYSRGTDGNGLDVVVYVVNAKEESALASVRAFLAPAKVEGGDQDVSEQQVFGEATYATGTACWVDGYAGYSLAVVVRHYKGKLFVWAARREYFLPDNANNANRVDLQYRMADDRESFKTTSSNILSSIKRQDD
jgi:hypothetical protein